MINWIDSLKKHIQQKTASFDNNKMIFAYLQSISDEINLRDTDTASVPANQNFTPDSMKIIKQEIKSLPAEQDLTHM